MNHDHLKKLMEMNENNQEIEATFFEMQKSMTLIAQQGKFLFDECVKNGFDENQALKFTISVLLGKVE